MISERSRIPTMSTNETEHAVKISSGPQSGKRTRLLRFEKDFRERYRRTLVSRTVSRPEKRKLVPKGKIRVWPTPYGWGLMFLMIWVPFTAVGTANNFLFIVFIMLIGLAFVSHRLGKNNVRCVALERRFPDEIFAATPFVVKYFVSTTRCPSGALTLRFMEQPPLEGAERGTAFFRVSPNESTAKGELAILPRRGFQSVGPGVLSSSFPFGLTTYSRQCGMAERVLVFPQIMPVDMEIPVWIGSSGRGFEQVGPFGTVPDHLREYVPGDAYKRIEWKKTAQTGTLMSKVLSDEEALEIIIRLPGNASELAISRAASLVVHFSNAGTPITLAGPGLSVGPGRGPLFMRHLLTLLALWEDRQTPEGAAASSRRGVLVNVDMSGELQWRYSGHSH